MESVLKNLANQLIHNLGGVKSPLLVDHVRECGGLAGRLETIKPSPVITGYRNKDEFSIGKDINGNFMLGHLVGNILYGPVTCVDTSRLTNIKESHKLIVKLYNRFLKVSHWQTYQCRNGCGHWNSIKIRSNLDWETMLIVRFHPQRLSADEMEAAKDDLREFFVHGEGRVCNLTSLYFQACRQLKCTNETSPYILLNGKPHLQETLLGYKFDISPDSFFQTNSICAEILYNTVKDYGELTKDTVLLDICCGTGTIGILMSGCVKKVIGVDKIHQAVADAKSNVDRNNVKNAHFICAKAGGFLQTRAFQDGLPDDHEGDLVAVLNPGRGGLKRKLIKSIRECPAIRRVVYVTCKPKGHCLENFKSLCIPEGKEYSGEPFLLKKAVPVDMFPQTNHCELVMQFTR